MVKVAILGASGGIGQPLSLLLKLSPYISKLALYDVRDPAGVAVDLSHINSVAEIESYHGDQLGDALRGARVVVIPAGVPRKPGMSRDDLFNINAGIVRTLCEGIARSCPNATVLVISNPVNSLVPVALETLRKNNVQNPENRVMGITTLDMVRAETFLGDYLNKARVSSVGSKQFDKRRMHKLVTVIGGHSGHTIVPVVLLKPLVYMMKPGEYDRFLNRVQFGGDEVVKAKQGQGSATYSMAFAAHRFVDVVLRSIQRMPTDDAGFTPAYVQLSQLPGGAEAQNKLGAGKAAAEYLSLPVVLRDGRIERIDSSVLDQLSVKEREMLKTALPELADNVRRGKRFICNPAKL
ncbi:malate dehydrogenase [Maudiozyma humilis]|uniref:Malate dehydrogenase n=1 Tax=Maudiozyma humilis TaxID=51915 RepID=A0AAV5RQ82_MAUHU|nr:malate dehydrogenase [Kazachstania humilis]